MRHAPFALILFGSCLSMAFDFAAVSAAVESEPALRIEDERLVVFIQLSNATLRVENKITQRSYEQIPLEGDASFHLVRKDTTRSHDSLQQRRRQLRRGYDSSLFQHENDDHEHRSEREGQEGNANGLSGGV